MNSILRTSEDLSKATGVTEHETIFVEWLGTLLRASMELKQEGHISMSCFSDTKRAIYSVTEGNTIRLLNHHGLMAELTRKMQIIMVRSRYDVLTWQAILRKSCGVIKQTVAVLNFLVEVKGLPESDGQGSLKLPSPTSFQMEVRSLLLDKLLWSFTEAQSPTPSDTKAEPILWIAGVEKS